MTHSRLPLAALALILISPVYANAQEATTTTTDTAVTDTTLTQTTADPTAMPGSGMLSQTEKQQFRDQMQNAQNAQERQQITQALQETIKTRIQQNKDLLGVPGTPNTAEKVAAAKEKRNETRAKAESRFGRGASIYGERAGHGGGNGGNGGGNGGNGGGNAGSSSGGSGGGNGGGHGGGMR